MIDDAFVEEFMKTDPEYGKGPEGLPDKPTYTRAEVDEIVQKTIKSTIESMQAAMAPASEPEEENTKEEEENGRQETAGEEPAGETE